MRLRVRVWFLMFPSVPAQERGEHPVSKEYGRINGYALIVEVHAGAIVRIPIQRGGYRL